MSKDNFYGMVKLTAKIIERSYANYGVKIEQDNPPNITIKVNQYWPLTFVPDNNYNIKLIDIDWFISQLKEDMATIDNYYDRYEDEVVLKWDLSFPMFVKVCAMITGTLENIEFPLHILQQYSDGIKNSEVAKELNPVSDVMDKEFISLKKIEANLKQLLKSTEDQREKRKKDN